MKPAVPVTQVCPEQIITSGVVIAGMLMATVGFLLFSLIIAINADTVVKAYQAWRKDRK